jgi:hypothetical protein
VAAGEGRGHWRKSCVSFTVAGLPAMSQWYRVAYGDVVKPPDTWHLIDRRPTLVSLSEPAVSQVDTAAKRNRVSSSSAVPDFFYRGALSMFDRAGIATPAWIWAQGHRQQGGEPTILFSHCTIRTPFNLSDRAICRALISFFVWQLANLSVTKF